MISLFVSTGIIIPTFRYRESYIDFLSGKEYIHTSIYPFKIPKIKRDEEKLNEIREEFLFSFNSYKNICWGYSELLATNDKCTLTLPGLTIVDSLSTLEIMKLKSEFNYSLDYLKSKYVFSGTYSTFETIIRFLAGFLSAYQTSKDDFFLNISKRIGDAIYDLYDMNESKICETGMFYTKNDGKILSNCEDWYISKLADVGTLQLEFMTLAAETKDPKYFDLVKNLYNKIFTKFPNKSIIHMMNQEQNYDIVTFGGGVDSFYEYILKTYLLSGRKMKKLFEKYVNMITFATEKAIIREHNMTTFGVYYNGTRKNVISHLSTFFAGLLVIGAVKENPNWKRDMNIAEELTHGYYKLYKLHNASLSPDCFQILPNGTIYYIKEEYMLRPETVESIYLMWKFTGKEIFREYNWDIFQTIKKYCKRKSGYTGLYDVRDPKWKLEKMESFFLAETLKYIYLTFEDNDYIHPDEWVFNTEAHPLRVWDEKTFERWEKYLDLGI